MWNGFDTNGAIREGTLFGVAAEHCHRTGRDKAPRQSPAKGTTKPQEAPRKPAPGMSPDEVFARCEPATNGHGYIAAKRAAGVPLDGLRVLPADDPLPIQGERMAGALVVPAYGPDGGLQSLQFIPRPPGKKMNLSGAPMAGASFTVGELVPGGVAYIVEGIGQAWACWQATGAAAVVCFGAGNVARVAGDLRQRDASARLVLVPDVGKEASAEKIAGDVGAAVAVMPEGWPNNADVNDLAQRDGLDVLEVLLEGATEPPRSEPRYKLLGSADLAALPPLAWCVRGVLPPTRSRDESNATDPSQFCAGRV